MPGGGEAFVVEKKGCKKLKKGKERGKPGRPAEGLKKRPWR